MVLRQTVASEVRRGGRVVSPVSRHSYLQCRDGAPRVPRHVRRPGQDIAAAACHPYRPHGDIPVSWSLDRNPHRRGLPRDEYRATRGSLQRGDDPHPVRSQDGVFELAFLQPEVEAGLGSRGRGRDRGAQKSETSDQARNRTLGCAEIERLDNSGDRALQLVEERARSRRGFAQERGQPAQARIQVGEERGRNRSRAGVGPIHPVAALVEVAPAPRAHAPRGLRTLQTEPPAGPALIRVAQPRTGAGGVHCHMERLACPHPAPERAQDPPRPEPLLGDLARKAGGVGRGRNRFRRQQARGVVVAVSVPLRTVEPTDDHERAVEADDPHHVLEDGLAVPAAEGFVHRLGVAVVDRRREVEVVQVVVASGEDQLTGSDQTETVEELRADGVRTGLSAVQAEEGGAHPPTPAGQREHAGMFVVGVGGDMEEAGRRGQLADAVPGAHRPAVHIQPFFPDGRREGEDAVERRQGRGRLPCGARWTRERARNHHGEDDKSKRPQGLATGCQLLASDHASPSRGPMNSTGPTSSTSSRRRSSMDGPHADSPPQPARCPDSPDDVHMRSDSQARTDSPGGGRRPTARGTPRGRRA